jgi:2'-5' RNA ligase
MRLFVSIDFPSEVIDRIELCIEQLISANKRREVRWVARESLHVTLFFIGEVHEDALNQIKKEIAQITASSQRFFLEFSKLMYLPNEEHPRVVAFELFERSGLLRDLSYRMGQSINHTSSQRNFIPHVTFGRIKDGRRLKVPDTIPVSLLGETIPVESVKLMSSVLTPAGPVYTVIEKFILHSV